MQQREPKVVLITGASSGIGQACANHLHRRGYRVYGTSRRPQPPTGTFEMIRMDVDQDESVRIGVEQVLQREGKLDVVVNNAGCLYAGAVEDTSLEEAKAQLETNFFGVLRVCRAVLPTMREQRSGCIINISSIGGLVAIPFQGLYSASKFAVEGLSESVSTEVRPFGISVVLVEPGDFHTGNVSTRQRAAAGSLNPAYQPNCAAALRVAEADEIRGGPPTRVAYCVERIIRSRRPRLRYVVGPVHESLVIQLKKVLPSRLFEWAIMTWYGVR